MTILDLMLQADRIARLIDQSSTTLTIEIPTIQVNVKNSDTNFSFSDISLTNEINTEKIIPNDIKFDTSDTEDSHLSLLKLTNAEDIERQYIYNHERYICQNRKQYRKERDFYGKAPHSGNSHFITNNFEFTKSKITEFVADITLYEIGAMSYQELYKKYRYRKRTIIISSVALRQEIYKFIKVNFSDAIEIVEKICIIRNPALIAKIQEIYSDKLKLDYTQVYILVSRTVIKSLYPGIQESHSSNIYIKILNVKYLRDEYFILTMHENPPLDEKIYASPLENAYIEFIVNLYKRRQIINVTSEQDRNALLIEMRKIHDRVRTNFEKHFGYSIRTKLVPHYSEKYSYLVKQTLIFRYAKDFSNGVSIDTIVEKATNDLLGYHKDANINRSNIQETVRVLLQKKFRFE